MTRNIRIAVALFIIMTGGGVSRASAADQLCDASYQNCRTQLLSLIRNERVGIDVAFWFMEDTRYSAALIERFKAGVPVRIIMDTRANASYPNNIPILKALKDAGIPMREKTSTGIVHWKTMIFAGQNWVEFSGANFTPSAFVPVTPYVDYNDEVIYYTNDPSIVGSFKTQFDKRWGATSGFRNYANVTSLARKYPVFPIAPELSFVPDQDFGARSVSLYNAETTGIDSIMYRITDARHTDALIAAKKRGLPVRLITEPLQYRDPVRLWHSWNVDRMYMAGISIRHRAHAGPLHQKSTIMRGQRTVVFGSSNWTTPSAKSQLEHNIFTKRTSFYSFFTSQFERKWMNATGHAETKPFVPLPPDTPSRPSPANGAAGQPLTVALKWYAGYWAHRYDVYLGTDPGAMRLVLSDRNMGPSLTTSQLKSFTVSGLARGRTYYWKVVSRTMANKTKTSPVWNFRTTP